MTTNDLVKLRNGSEEFRPLVAVTMLSLRSLVESGKGIVVYELVELCRDPDHILWGKTGEDLKKLSLVEPQGTVHDSIRNIVLSAVDGEELDMRLHSPMLEGAAR